MGLLEDDLYIVNRILHHRLQRDDIKHILSQLSDQDQAAFADKVGRVLNRTSALLEVSRKVTEELSLDKMLPKMVEIISEFIEAERATVFLHDQATQELFSRVAQGDLNFEIRLSDQQGLVGACFQSGQSLIVNQPYNDPRFDSEIDQKSGYTTRNVLCTPIKHNERLIGVLQVLNRQEPGFDNSDQLTLEALAQHAAIGFENARLYDQISRARNKEQRLFDVTTAISQELQLKPLLMKIMEVVTSFLIADRSTLFLYDSQNKELWSQVAQGSDEIRFPAHLGIAGTAFSQSLVINIPEAYEDHRFNPTFDKQTGYRTKTILCMPIYAKSNEPIGVIQVINKLEGIFTHEDERSLKAFAAQASIAIENAQLFEEVMSVKRYNEAVLESMSNGVMTLDAQGNLVTLNRVARLLLGGDHLVKHLQQQAQTGNFLDLCHRHLPWLAQIVERVQIESNVVTSIDHPFDTNGLMHELLLLNDSTRDQIHPPLEKRSVNVTAVPLIDTEQNNSGTILLLEDMSKEKRLKSTMSRYLPSEVADQLLRDGGETLGGSLQEATILFSDIRSFTSISEAIGAQETVKMLNDYFGVMVDVISEHHGILDKFIGDAIMAVFGAPLPSKNDAENAVQTAVEMLRVLDRLNQNRLKQGEPHISIGIGLNTGEVLSGNIGSSKRMDYTVIGDAVNLAARLESATKGFGTELLISEFTAKNIKRHHPLREVDLIRVKGKTKPVRVYEVITHKLEQDPRFIDNISNYEEGLLRYRRGDWQGAIERFRQNDQQDRLSELYTTRCQHFMLTAPPPDWDGVWTMQKK